MDDGSERSASPARSATDISIYVDVDDGSSSSSGRSRPDLVEELLEPIPIPSSRTPTAPTRPLPPLPHEGVFGTSNPRSPSRNHNTRSPLNYKMPIPQTAPLSRGPSSRRQTPSGTPQIPTITRPASTPVTPAVYDAIPSPRQRSIREPAPESTGYFDTQPPLPQTTPSPTVAPESLVENFKIQFSF
ncbi:hypothetical protein SISSUDRAFT_1064720 [Sistotremastrum suecicum HHB10207 ss-3]|uniref:Uncharacterized protein n=1 Tax=Sistotremastrum suecicum HHB10207 ss-3 TaxID=1314776 RepID=A0A166ABJ6_9AGAM|nr:hypothetical protein SISSUDRAFT_1064720 [Sistotremastrum suecicum HHB10207 ss-3]